MLASFFERGRVFSSFLRSTNDCRTHSRATRRCSTSNASHVRVANKFLVDNYSFPISVRGSEVRKAILRMRDCERTSGACLEPGKNSGSRYGSGIFSYAPPNNSTVLHDDAKLEALCGETRPDESDFDASLGGGRL